MVKSDRPKPPAGSRQGRPQLGSQRGAATRWSAAPKGKDARGPTRAAGLNSRGLQHALLVLLGVRGIKLLTQGWQQSVPANQSKLMTMPIREAATHRYHYDDSHPQEAGKKHAKENQA